MWLSQVSSAGSPDLATWVISIATVLASVVGFATRQMLLAWRERTTEATVATAALMKGKDDEIAYLRSRLAEAEARNRYLEDDRAETKDEMAAVVTWLKGRTQPPRKDSPQPSRLLPDTGYSISTTNPTKTRR